MSGLTLLQNNGFSGSPALGSKQSEVWLQASVQKFFSAVNWEDNPPEVQDIKFTSQESSTSLSMTLSVTQFFNAFNWEGAAIAAAPVPQQQPTPPTANDLTLDDFSSLF